MDNDYDITHSRIRHAGLDRLQVQEQLGGGAVLQHLHHLLQHRQVHRLDHLHRRLHFLHFVQDLITFRPWTLFVYVPSVGSHLLVDIRDVAGNSYESIKIFRIILQGHLKIAWYVCWAVS